MPRQHAHMSPATLRFQRPLPQVALRSLCIAASLATSVLAACGGDSGGTTSPASASLSVALTDAPFPFDSVARADLFIVRIDGKMADADSADAESHKDNDSSPNRDPSKDWVTLAAPNQAFNLLDLQSGKSVNLGQPTLPTGTYRGFRLVLDTDKSSVTLKNGTVLSGANGMIKFPSAGRTGIKIQLDKPVAVVSGSTQLMVDFDLGRSFVLRGKSIGKNGLLFKPVIRGTAQDMTGGVSGTVHATTASGAVVPNASVEILKSGTALNDTVSANVVATTKTDTNGVYTAMYLLPASYTVRATPPAGSANAAALLPAVVVASGKTTAGADIVLP